MDTLRNWTEEYTTLPNQWIIDDNFLLLVSHFRNALLLVLRRHELLAVSVQSVSLIKFCIYNIKCSVPLPLCIFWILLPACLDCLNLFWFRKMVMGALKAMAASDSGNRVGKDGSIESSTKIKKREKVKQYVQEKYVNFKSIIMRRKPAILRRRQD